MSYTEPYLSTLTQVSWGEEDVAYKTRPTNIDEYIRLVGKPDMPWPLREVETVHAFSHGRAPAYVNDQQKWKMDGTFPMEVVSGEFFGAVFGLCVTTGSDPYTHTFNISDAMPKSFAVQYGIPGTANLIPEFLGCRAGKAMFKSSEDSEKLLCDIDYMAAKPANGSSIETITTTATPPFNRKQGVFSSTALYTGARARVHGFELPININIKPNYVQGDSYYPYEILPGKADFGELKLTVGLEDNTEWDEIFDDTKPGTIYDYEQLYTRGANDTLKFSGNAKLKGAPPELTDEDIRAVLTLVPITCTLEVVDSVAAYPFE